LRGIGGGCRYNPPVVTKSKLLLSLVLPLIVAALPAAADETSPVFKIYVEHAGVYSLTFERLESAGLPGATPSAGIGLRHRGEPHPIWVEDGGDGVFGPGDEVLFMGDVLHGEVSYLDPHSRYNCYFLDFGDPSPRRGTDAPGGAPTDASAAGLRSHHHLEPDRVMVRFRARDGVPEEEWYWRRLSVADKKPFTEIIALDGLLQRRPDQSVTMSFADVLSESVRSAEPDPARIESELSTIFGAEAEVMQATTVVLRLGLRGWSEPRHAERDALPHHQVDIEIDGRSVESVAWDGNGHHVHEVEVPATHLDADGNELTLRVPKRFYPESGDFVVDVVLLNWIELEYERRPEVADEQVRFQLADAGDSRPVRVEGPPNRPVDLFLSEGVRIRGGNGGVEVELPDGVEEFSALGTAASPNEVVLDRPSRLAGTDHRADYIMITHRSLLEGTRRLADFHRSRGLEVEVVDVQDIYDEFNFGILDPRAIKDFLEHAHTSWQRPAPRFVLLAGDASWDFKNTTVEDSNYADWTYRPGESRRFVKNSSTPYAEGAELNHRNLVPTSSFRTLEGHAASDTWFVCFDDGDELPDMAIGRIPVVSPEELDGVIDKTMAFAAAPPVGPWRRNLLFIANESVGFQRRSDAIAQTYSERGYVSEKIYPHPSEPANEAHTRRIIEQFDDGVYAVHFIGHGGRYIWRTGPPDLAKNHDLFTLDHLDKLAPNGRLPVVLSLTCYSAPFDHPTADSIGEKLMRIPDKGAVAVFAASWRNSPSPIMGEKLLAELTTPGVTIGEAVMRAKHEFRSQILVQTYNLLGDPAVPVGAPSEALSASLESAGGGARLEVSISSPVGSGTLLADWVDENGATIREDRIAVTGREFELELGGGVLGSETGLAGVKVYVWDEERRIDGIGWAALDAAADETSPEEPPATAPAGQPEEETRGNTA